MDNTVLLLALLNFALIIATPRIFFRRDGSFNARWWSASAPHGLCPLFLVAARVFHLAPVVPQRWLEVTGLVAVVFLAGAVALLTLTMGTHRIPLSLWHQTNDAPREIVTWGPYRWVRHPFYCSYLLTYLGTLALFPHWVTIAMLLYMAVILNDLAGREERKLSASAFGAEYLQYMARTRRFLPIGARRPASAVKQAST
ncbi:MAG: isoprenylcysteine carboxylmethyltransferase family protein [Nocardiopsaceae bacterium]|nr:isoprenylcysteine carboxylmethyltransferase family protein [Nocardiopsaceae bacterium]